VKLLVWPGVSTSVGVKPSELATVAVNPLSGPGMMVYTVPPAPGTTVTLPVVPLPLIAPGKMVHVVLRFELTTIVAFAGGTGDTVTVVDAEAEVLEPRQTMVYVVVPDG
jgi:hypothetical protein